MFRKRQHTLNPISFALSFMFAGATSYAFDPNDPADAKALEEAVAKATAPLIAKRDELLGEVKKLRKDSAISPEEFERVTAERDELQAKFDKASKDLKAAATQAETVTKALEGERGYTNRLLVDNGLAAALAEAGVKNPVHLKAAAALIRASAPVEVKVDGESRAAMVGDKPLGDFVKAWATSDDGKAFVSAPVNNGGGAGGAGGGGGSTVGKVDGTPQERAAYFASKLPAQGA